MSSVKWFANKQAYSLEEKQSVEMQERKKKKLKDNFHVVIELNILNLLKKYFHIKMGNNFLQKSFHRY